MKLTWRIWLLIIFVIASLLLIYPISSLNKTGVEVKYVEKNTTILEKGLKRDYFC